MKLFIFAIGARDRASSRLRVWDHVDWLGEQGYIVTADSLTGPGRIGKVALVARILRRLPSWIRHFWRSNVVLLQESMLLWPLLLVRNIAHPRRIIFDFSDPVDRVGHGWRRALRRRLLSLVVRNSDVVVVENRAYLSRFPEHTAKFCHFYGPVNAARYGASGPPETMRASSGKVRIGWTGSPSTVGFIAKLFPIIDKLSESHEIELVLMGVGSVEFIFRHTEVSFLDWDEAAEFATVPSFDIGLFRLESTEDALWRGAGKLFVYCAAGVPFLASSRGIARDLMISAKLGFPVLSEEAWPEVLADAIANQEQRNRQRQLLKQFAQQHLSYESYRQSLLAWINGPSPDLK